MSLPINSKASRFFIRIDQRGPITASEGEFKLLSHSLIRVEAVRVRFPGVNLCNAGQGVESSKLFDPLLSEL